MEYNVKPINDYWLQRYRDVEKVKEVATKYDRILGRLALITELDEPEAMQLAQEYVEGLER